MFKHLQRYLNITRIQFSGIFSIISFLISIISFHLIFREFFPNQQQNIGTDYSYFLPMLLNGFYWYQVNGLFEVPWFTPAFCAGVPFFPNPQVMYYSVPQFLTFIFDPLLSVYITFILFASLGYIGFYLLLRNIFSTTSEVAAFGAAVFLFNGFYVHRMIIGHLTYHSFMLIPLVAYFLLRNPVGKNNNVKANNIVLIFLAGLSIAYMMHSGAANFIIPALLSVIGIWMINVIWGKESPVFWTRLVCAGLIAVLLSASKLVAGIAFLRNFPRDYYTLPGIEGLFGSLLFVLKAMFLRINAVTETGNIVNYVIEIEYFQHELEYSVTIIPLLILIGYFFYLFRKLINTKAWSNISRRRKQILFIFTGLLLLPVILNIYTPAWNALLKSMPYIKNSSSLLRWIAINIPLVVIVSALALNIIKHQYTRYAIATLGIAGIIFINILNDRNWYQGQIYSPDEIVNAYDVGKQKKQPPEIKYIGAYVQENYKFDPDVVNRNDVLVYGISQLACNEAIFGYKLERFPFGRIDTGEVLDDRNGSFNIKNPVCYIFGNENNCKPGDQITVDKRKVVEAFVSYKPLNFRKPLFQVIANWVSIISLLYVSIVLFLIVLIKITKTIRIVN